MTRARLYQMLVAPSGVSFAKDSKVYVIADGGLNSLNFEPCWRPVLSCITGSKM